MDCLLSLKGENLYNKKSHGNTDNGRQQIRKNRQEIHIIVKENYDEILNYEIWNIRQAEP